MKIHLLSFFFFSFFLVYLPSPNLGLTPPGLTTQMPVGQMPVEQQSLDQNTRQIHKGGPPRMCDHHNVRASAGGNKDCTQRTHTQSQDRN